jgi:hypothetical protein
VRTPQIVEKILKVAARRLVTSGKAIATAQTIDKTAARIIRAAAGVGVPTARISRVTGEPAVTTAGFLDIPPNTRVITARISRLIGGFGKITAGIFSVTRDTDVITKEIYGAIAPFDGTPEDIMLQGQVAEIHPLPSITANGIPADSTKKEVTAEPIDASGIRSKK